MADAGGAVVAAVGEVVAAGGAVVAAVGGKRKKGQAAGSRKSSRVVPGAAGKPEAGAMNEDRLAAEADGSLAAEVVTQSFKDSAYWSGFDTRLLAAWLIDYDEEKFVPLRTNRDALIATLVTDAGATYKRPKSIKDLQEIWKSFNMDWKQGEVPGRFVAGKQSSSAKSGAAGAAASSASSVPEQVSSAAAAAASPSPASARSERTPARSPPLMQTALRRSAPQPSESEDEDMGVEDITPAARSSQACKTCGAQRPPSNSSSAPASWVCQGPAFLFESGVCGLRGDLQVDDPINAMAIAARTKREEAARAITAALSAPSPSGAASSSSRQSFTEHTASSARVTTLEQEFDRLAAVAPAFPLFALPAGSTSAEREALVAAALKEGKAAVDATKFLQPTPALLSLIQSGKLVHVGWALPKPIDRKEEEDQVTFSSSGGITAKSKAITDPIKLTSLAQFSSALFSTILPALIAQPAATAQWLALARSVAQLEQNLGWTAARTYLDRVLQARVQERAAFSEVHATVFLAISVEAAASRAGNRDAHGQGQSNRDQPPVKTHCYDFNSMRGCSRSECNRKHVCVRCGEAHAVKDCPKPRRDDHHRHPSHRGGGGGRA